jgi:hypothetical protein
MNFLTKILQLVCASVALFGLVLHAADAATILKGTVTGTGTPGTVILQAHNQAGATDSLKFKFSAPKFNAGTRYYLQFCIGPAVSPCAQTSYVVQVPDGESRLAVIPASVFTNNVLVVQQATRTTVPYAVIME